MTEFKMIDLRMTELKMTDLRIRGIETIEIMIETMTEIAATDPRVRIIALETVLRTDRTKTVLAAVITEVVQVVRGVPVMAVSKRDVAVTMPVPDVGLAAVVITEMITEVAQAEDL